jgi:hypothetical protein
VFPKWHNGHNEITEEQNRAFGKGNCFQLTMKASIMLVILNLCIFSAICISANANANIQEAQENSFLNERLELQGIEYEPNNNDGWFDINKFMDSINNSTMQDFKEHAKTVVENAKFGAKTVVENAKFGANTVFDGAKSVADSMGNVAQTAIESGSQAYANNKENLSWLRTAFGEKIANSLSALGSLLNWLPWVLDILWYTFLIYTWMVRGMSLTLFFFVAKEWICINPTSAMQVLKFVIGCIHMMQKFIRPLLLSCILMVFAHPCYSFVVIITFYFLKRKFIKYLKENSTKEHQTESFFFLQKVVGIKISTFLYFILGLQITNNDYNEQIKFEAQIEVEKKLHDRLEKAVFTLESLIANTNTNRNTNTNTNDAYNTFDDDKNSYASNELNSIRQRVLSSKI